MDWATRKILSWRVSNTLTTDFALMQCARPSRATVARTPSIPTRAVNLRTATSPGYSKSTTSASAWTVRVAGATTSLSSDCGGVSSMRRSICKPTIQAPQRKQAWKGISISITPDDRTRRLTGRRPIRCTSTTCRRPESRYDHRRAPLIQVDLLSKQCGAGSVKPGSVDILG